MWTKICGITSVEQAELVAGCEPSAVGLNFWSGSKRGIDTATGQEIVSALPTTIEPVGLFVNQPIDEVVSIVQTTGVRLVQCHGDETPAALKRISQRLPNVEFLLVVRGDDLRSEAIADRIAESRRLELPVKACLVDAAVSGAYGGTGTKIDWARLSRSKGDDDLPLILAGGLTAENVAEAIRIVEPFGVDVASGVEVAPGRKSKEKVNAFLTAAASMG